MDARVVSLNLCDYSSRERFSCFVNLSVSSFALVEQLSLDCRRTLNLDLGMGFLKLYLFGLKFSLLLHACFIYLFSFVP